MAHRSRPTKRLPRINLPGLPKDLKSQLMKRVQAAPPPLKQTSVKRRKEIFKEFGKIADNRKNRFSVQEAMVYGCALLLEFRGISLRELPEESVQILVKRIQHHKESARKKRNRGQQIIK